MKKKIDFAWYFCKDRDSITYFFNEDEPFLYVKIGYKHSSYFLIFGLKPKLFQTRHQHEFSSYFPPTFKFLIIDSLLERIYQNGSIKTLEYSITL